MITVATFVYDLGFAYPNGTQDLASDASQAAYDATREPTTFEKAKGYMRPPSTADKAKAQTSDAYATAKVGVSWATQKSFKGLTLPELLSLSKTLTRK